MHSADYNQQRAESLDCKKSVARWLRVQAAAAYLGLGVSTLNKLRLRGGGPRFARLGSAVTYDIADLDSYAIERKVRSTSEPVRAA